MSPSSRYAGTLRAVLPSPDGGGAPYLQRRVIPAAPTDPAPATVSAAAAGARLDLLAAKLLGDPLLSWRLADVNTVFDPLQDALPTRLRIPQPGR